MASQGFRWDYPTVVQIELNRVEVIFFSQDWFGRATCVDVRAVAQLCRTEKIKYKGVYIRYYYAVTN